MEPLILTFDVGTQSTRALLIDKKGVIEALYQATYEKPFLEPTFFGQTEQKVSYYFDKICLAVKELKKKDQDGKLFRRIKAVTIATFRDSVVLLDKACQPLSNLIIWMDERKASRGNLIPKWEKKLFSLLGKKEMVSMLYSNTRYNWFRENAPELLEKTSKIVMLSGYLYYRLTGVLKDSVANQVGHIPFDNKHRKWIKHGLSRCISDIPVNMLIDLVESGEVLGNISKEASELSDIPQGLPVIATGTDKACEALGLSVITNDKAAISLGTAATIQICSKKYFEPEPFLPSYASIIKGHFNAENQIYRGYWIVTWFKKNFCDYENVLAKERGCSVESILDTYLEEVPVGCNGLIMTPHLAPGAGNPFAKSVITGLTDKHTKKHLYRAIVESINFELMHAMKRMQRRGGFRIKELYVAGGGSVCDSIMQITSDMFGLPVKRIQTHEATAIGAAIAGFVGLKEFADFTEATKSMCHDTDIFIPITENHKKYSEIYRKIYRVLERTNTPLFKAIKTV